MNREQAGFDSLPAKRSDGVVCILDSVHYTVEVTVGVVPRKITKMRCSLDTGAVFKIIRRDSLPPGLEYHVHSNATPPRLSD